MLPSIANEIDNNIAEFHRVIRRIDELDNLMNSTSGVGGPLNMEAANNNAALSGLLGNESNVTSQEPKLLQEYSRLRATMKARMEEISSFYDDNLDDERIHFFEKLRLKIKKALHNRPGKAA